MENTRNRYIVLIAVMLLASVLVNFLTYDTYHKAEVGIETIASIPLELGRWQGKDVPLEKLVYEILETRSIINRVYHTETGQEVFLSIVYYPDTKVDFHAPEGCLGGQGIELEKSSATITLINNSKTVEINLNKLVWQKGNRENLVYYFYKTGEFLGQSYIKLRLNLATNKFTNKARSGSLIRISTPIPIGDTQKASNILVDFVEQLYPSLIKYL